MRQIVTMVIACTVLVLVPALSSAADYTRSNKGFIRGKQATVFEKGYEKRHPGKHLGHQKVRHERQKNYRQHDRSGRHVYREHNERHCNSRYTTKHDTRHHRNHRHAPVHKVVRENIVLNPFFPVVPSRLVLHFSF